jgi:hypothetical protein
MNSMRKSGKNDVKLIFFFPIWRLVAVRVLFPSIYSKLEMVDTESDTTKTSKWTASCSASKYFLVQIEVKIILDPKYIHKTALCDQYLGGVTSVGALWIGQEYAIQKMWLLCLQYRMQDIILFRLYSTALLLLQYRYDFDERQSLIVTYCRLCRGRSRS